MIYRMYIFLRENKKQIEISIMRIHAEIDFRKCMAISILHYKGNYHPLMNIINKVAHKRRITGAVNKKTIKLFVSLLIL